MKIQKNISLKPFNTFGIDVNASNYCDIRSNDELISCLDSIPEKEIVILGGGSNMLLTKDIDALVIHLNLKSITVEEENDDSVIVKALAGENWHEFVLWCLDNDFGGVENLSLIPGNIGTAPIQNIGAYGVELKDVFVSCEALEIETKQIKTFTASDCQFGYRDSIFKNSHKGKYIIISVNIKLSKKNHTLHLDYGAIKDQLKESGILSPTIKDVSEAVIAIRQNKLPDPKKIGNSGSFFKNPVISVELFKALQNNFDDVPHYKISESEIKVPAGWLIEKAGFKGKRFNNYGVHKNQALVLVNYGGAKGEDIYKLALLIKSTVKRLFNIDIEPEVNVI
ncbi:UDP-N-acetylmuramate dehydrogenase [Winogradskyella poriferorum]|uniref:UDP-N-acetylmuramate dehydrogenase n=1 Tax=Winogradskyella poriferorum TaxID=307627 RepID=UPI003D661903